MEGLEIRLTEMARSWAGYTGTLDEMLRVARDELDMVAQDMSDPDLPRDHPEQLTIFDLCFHTFVLGEDEYICTPAQVGGQRFILIDLCRREEPREGIVMPIPETPQG
jgi:hypothetical protein